MSRKDFGEEDQIVAEALGTIAASTDDPENLGPRILDSFDVSTLSVRLVEAELRHNVGQAIDALATAQSSGLFDRTADFSLVLDGAQASVPVLKDYPDAGVFAAPLVTAATPLSELKAYKISKPSAYYETFQFTSKDYLHAGLGHMALAHVVQSGKVNFNLLPTYAGKKYRLLLEGRNDATVDSTESGCSARWMSEFTFYGGGAQRTLERLLLFNTVSTSSDPSAIPIADLVGVYTLQRKYNMHGRGEGYYNFQVTSVLLADPTFLNFKSDLFKTPTLGGDATHISWAINNFDSTAGSSTYNFKVAAEYQALGAQRLWAVPGWSAIKKYVAPLNAVGTAYHEALGIVNQVVVNAASAEEDPVAIADGIMIGRTVFGEKSAMGVIVDNALIGADAVLNLRFDDLKRHANQLFHAWWRGVRGEKVTLEDLRLH